VERQPPPDVLEAAGSTGSPTQQLGSHVWLVTASDRRFVLRQCVDDCPMWVHPFLRAATGRFPIPAPIDAFGGQSFIADPVAGTWEAVSYLPGREIGFDDQPSLHSVGAFLAAFHEVSLSIGRDHRPRPDGIPLRRLADAVDWDGAPVTMGSARGVEDLRDLLERWHHDVARSNYDQLATCVVHGDPTTFNVLAGGHPRRPTALIDFELADVEPPIADVAFCLWRSGRPHQSAAYLDRGRVRDFVRGYESVRPLTDEERAALPMLLRGRGLQMLVKRTQRRVADVGPIDEVRWLEDHNDDLVHLLAHT